MSGLSSEHLPDAWRAALRGAAREAFELGGLQGLCTEGQVELAVSAMRTLTPDSALDSEMAERIREVQIRGLIQRGRLDGASSDPQ